MATATAQQMFVDGAWQPSATGETFEATSPATGELIGTVPQGDRDDARRDADQRPTVHGPAVVFIAWRSF